MANGNHRKERNNCNIIYKKNSIISILLMMIIYERHISCVLKNQTHILTKIIFM